VTTTNRNSWRIIPSDALRATIEAMARAQNRSIAQTCILLIGAALDRARLETAIDSAGMTKAIRVLEGAAISQNRQPMLSPTMMAGAAPR
jgi:hypothetical protein